MTCTEMVPVNSTILPPRLIPVGEIKDDESFRRQGAWRDLRATLGTRYGNCFVQDFECGTEPTKALAVETIKKYLGGFAENFAAGRGLMLAGPSGTGKDHLMAAAMREAVRAGYSVHWINGLDFFGEMRDRIDADRPESDVIKKLARPDIFAISDPLPPWGPLTPFQAQVFFRVIDRRYRDQKPIWMTVNVHGKSEAVDRLGASIVDRLRHRAVVLSTHWESYREPQ